MVTAMEQQSPFTVVLEQVQATRRGEPALAHLCDAISRIDQQAEQIRELHDFTLSADEPEPVIFYTC